MQLANPFCKYCLFFGRIAGILHPINGPGEHFLTNLKSPPQRRQALTAENQTGPSGLNSGYHKGYPQNAGIKKPAEAGFFESED
ncbi:MAG: hypothetical protein CMH98_15725 [Oceanospirillaceae bacterium]|nr:hypothetical protein [Oceanospirillaceae bacterium]